MIRHRFKRGPRIKVGPKGKRTRDGMVFDSQKEARRYDELKVARAVGDVVFFLRQVPFHLPGGVIYRADFLVFWTDGNVTVEDVKGMRTERYRMNKRLVEGSYPVEITEI